MELVAPMVSKDKGKGAYIIPLPDFEDLKSSKSRTGELQALRMIVKRAAGTKHPAQGFLYFPGALVCNKKGREYTLGTRFGTNVEWIKFVFEYVKYAVNKFDTFMDARSWFENERKRFKHCGSIVGATTYLRHGSETWSNPEKGYEHNNISNPVSAALNRLKPEFRTVLVLSDMNDMSYKEISSMIDVPIGTVMSRLFRARRNMRGMLTEHARTYGFGASAQAA